MKVVDPKVPASKLYFTDDANFEAVFSNSGGADCLGIIVVSWSATKLVLTFGNAYGTLDRWYLINGAIRAGQRVVPCRAGTNDLEARHCSHIQPGTAE